MIIFIFEVYFHSLSESTHEISTPSALQAQHPPKKKFTVQRINLEKLLFLHKAERKLKILTNNALESEIFENDIQ